MQSADGLLLCMFCAAVV